MTGPIDIYCYADPSFSGDLNALIDALRGELKRVLVGDDLNELLLLLELTTPTVLILAIPSEVAASFDSFNLLSKIALTNGLPMIVANPQFDVDGCLLFAPQEDRLDFKESRFPFPQTSTILNQLSEEQNAGTTTDRNTPNRITPILITPITETSASGDATPNIATISNGRSTPVDIKAHVLASRGFKSDVSGPILLTPQQQPEKLAEQEPSRKSPKITFALLSGALLALLAAFYLATKAGRPLPKPLSSSDSNLGMAPLRIDSVPNSLNKPASSSSEEGDTGDSTADQVVGLPLEIVPFPGRFQAGRSSFAFPEKWEKRRFDKIIQNTLEREKILLIGHYTTLEQNHGGRELALKRAKSAGDYLQTLGISASRIRFESASEPFRRVDRNARGKPRNRWVDVVFE